MRAAFAFIETVTVRPNHVTCEPGPDHLRLLADTCDAADATGDLISDAMLATLAREHGARLASLDRDFARFPGLDWVLPQI